MTPDEAREKLRDLAAERERNAEAEPQAIVQALRLGVKQVDIVRDIRRTREHVRRIRVAAEKAGQLPVIKDDE